MGSDLEDRGVSVDGLDVVEDLPSSLQRAVTVSRSDVQRRLEAGEI